MPYEERKIGSRRNYQNGGGRRFLVYWEKVQDTNLCDLDEELISEIILVERMKEKGREKDEENEKDTPGDGTLHVALENKTNEVLESTNQGSKDEGRVEEEEVLIGTKRADTLRKDRICSKIPIIMRIQ